MILYMQDVRGKFGFDEEKWCLPTYGMNAKGGMDDDKFEKYLFGSIIPLYPNAKDEKGKQILVKVNSGQGRMNSNLIACLRLLGFVL